MTIQHRINLVPVPAEFLQGLRTNPVTVNDSLKHHNRTSTKRTKKNAGMERRKKEKNKNKPATKRRKGNRPTRREQKKEKKRNKGKGCNMLE